jgi:hypothetical protein
MGELGEVIPIKPIEETSPPACAPGDGGAAQKQAVKRAAPKWEEAARERVKGGIKKYSTHIADLGARDANEGDTRLMITDFLCDVLGYDKYNDLTTEKMVKGEFADYGIRLDNEMVGFIEVKRAKTKLGEKQLRQVQSYAANEGVSWMILTNGSEWQVYHLSDTVPLVNDLLFAVDLLGPEGPASKAKWLFYLTREAMKRNQMDELWKARRATCPKALGQLLRSPAVVESLRKELWKMSGHRLEADGIVALLEQTVLKPECLEK